MCQLPIRIWEVTVNTAGENLGLYGIYFNKAKTTVPASFG